MNGIQEKQLPLYELYGLWHEPFWRKTWFISSISLLIFLCIILIAFLLYNYFKTKKSILLPWQEAFRDLKNLEGFSYESPEKHKIFYEKITRIVKRYLSKRYTFSLESKTDEEVMSALCVKSLSQETQEALKDILEGAVFIKFANQRAVQEKMKHDLEQVHVLIKKTMPE